MIIRSSVTPLKTDHHRTLLTRISQLQQENKQLRTQLMLLEQKLLEQSAAKEKYKSKYRVAKQKAEILGMLGKQSPLGSPCEKSPLQTPRKPINPLRTFSSEELNSIRIGPVSDLSSRLETRVQVEPVRPLPLSLPISLQNNSKQEQQKIICSLVKLHQQLDKLSKDIEKQPLLVGGKTSLVQEQVYKKMEEVVERMARMQTRDVERQARRIAHQREQAMRRNNVRSLDTIGKDLADFRIVP